MNIPYLTFLKHAEKVIKDAPEHLHMLQGVYHSGGFAYVTDSFRVYRAKSQYTAGEEETIEIATGLRLDGTYPNVKAVVPTSDSIATTKLNVKHALGALKALQQAGTVSTAPGGDKTRKKDVILKLGIGEGGPTISTVRGAVTATYEIQSLVAGSEQIKVAFNANYMIQALEMFKDTSVPKVRWNIYGEKEPFTLSIDGTDDLTALIMPVYYR